PPATTTSYTLSLHDALPIYARRRGSGERGLTDDELVKDAPDGVEVTAGIDQLPTNALGRHVVEGPPHRRLRFEPFAARTAGVMRRETKADEDGCAIDQQGVLRPQVTIDGPHAVPEREGDADAPHDAEHHAELAACRRRSLDVCRVESDGRAGLDGIRRLLRRCMSVVEALGGLTAKRTPDPFAEAPQGLAFQQVHRIPGQSL